MELKKFEDFISENNVSNNKNEVNEGVHNSQRRNS